MEHLLNCHGEMSILLALLGNLPFLGLVIRAFLPSTTSSAEVSPPKVEP